MIKNEHTLSLAIKKYSQSGEGKKLGKGLASTAGRAIGC
jgi:hypothetical protein